MQKQYTMSKLALQLLYITLTSSVILVPGGGPVRGLGLGHSDIGGTGTEVCRAVTSRSICDDAGAIWDLTKAGEANADMGDCLCYKIRGKKKYWISLRNKIMSEHIWLLKKRVWYWIWREGLFCYYINYILLLHQSHSVTPWGLICYFFTLICYSIRFMLLLHLNRRNAETHLWEHK